ncbi:hypothetical protein KJ830_06990 [bacterium]|nr:hypothetical protein [bacterium]MBU4510774.1 hypothetical protein [bacterium]
MKRKYYFVILFLILAIFFLINASNVNAKMYKILDSEGNIIRLTNDPVLSIKETEAGYAISPSPKSIIVTAGQEKRGELKAYYDGNRYLELSENQKLSYVAGLIDMLFSFSQTLVPEGYAEIALKTEGMSLGQLTSIFNKFLEEHPEDWHFSAAYLFSFAMAEIFYEK